MSTSLTDVKLSKRLGGLLDFLVKMAKDMLEKFGEFDPVGMVVTEEGKVISVDSTFMRPGEVVKGLTGNQLVRMVEDGIRKIKSETRLDCAIILHDVTLRSQDGSMEPKDALMGHLEERNKIACLVIIEYEIKNGHFKITSAYSNPTEYHLILD